MTESNEAIERKSSRECALIAARAADEKKATDILVQDVRDLVGVTDYFIIVTAANNRQVNAIVDAIEEELTSFRQIHIGRSCSGLYVFCFCEYVSAESFHR